MELHEDLQKMLNSFYAAYEDIHRQEIQKSFKEIAKEVYCDYINNLFDLDIEKGIIKPKY